MPLVLGITRARLGVGVENEAGAVIGAGAVTGTGAVTGVGTVTGAGAVLGVGAVSGVGAVLGAGAAIGTGVGAVLPSPRGGGARKWVMRCWSDIGMPVRCGELGPGGTQEPCS